MLKFSCTVVWRLGTRGPLRKYSNTAAFKASKLESMTTASDRVVKSSEDDKDNPSLVAAAFASLSSPESDIPKRPSLKSAKFSKAQQLEIQILKSTDINSLLAVAENPNVTRRHALKMVSILSEWSNDSKVKLSEFESDPRFLKLCRLLARTSTSQAIASMTAADDLSTVLGITGDDEAAKLISNLTLTQMVKVMKSLQAKGRRSTPLLRALAHNIVKQSEILDLKKSADLLFSMASLNFPDPVLLDRICSDVIECLPSNDSKVAVVNSIAVSLGLMRYHHERCLSALLQWVSARDSAPGVRANMLLTAATLHWVSPPLEDFAESVATLKEEDLVKPSAWLDLVFALLILNRATEQHLASTLRPEFIERLLSSGEFPIPTRRKLQTIDAYLSLAHGGGGRLGEAAGAPLAHRADKAALVGSALDTFRSLVSSERFMRTNCDSRAGFLYDGEFAVDSKCHPIPLEKAANDKSVFRIAVMCLDYHDMCRKSCTMLGVNHLYTRILELKGFKVLHIPYTEFNPKDNLVTRVQYIQKRLREIVEAQPARS